MKLPNNENAVVEDAKILDYLLSENHPVGKHKAKVFRCLGFHEANVEDFRQSLKSIAEENEVASIRTAKHGIKYSVIGILIGPTGESSVLTAWIIENGTDFPRLVTAYPESE